MSDHRITRPGELIEFRLDASPFGGIRVSLPWLIVHDEQERETGLRGFETRRAPQMVEINIAECPEPFAIMVPAEFADRVVVDRPGDGQRVNRFFEMESGGARRRLSRGDALRCAECWCGLNLRRNNPLKNHLVVTLIDFRAPDHRQVRMAVNPLLLARLGLLSLLQNDMVRLGARKPGGLCLQRSVPYYETQPTGYPKKRGKLHMWLRAAELKSRSTGKPIRKA